MKEAQALPPPIWVDRPASFRAMLAHLRGEPALAVDTESNSLYVYHEQVCLVQISVPGTDYLVDPLTLEDISGLGPLLADPGVLKVFHGAEYDLSVLHQDFGFTIANLFDTMWASRILGWPAHGLAALLETHFGVHLNKKYQRANWGVRPLPPAQLDYARLDTHYLLPLQAIQARELEARQRWPQARHRFEKLAQTRSHRRGFDAEGFWRLSGARDLDDVGRGVLRELYLYRDRIARAENRPPFKVFSNKLLLDLSARRPRNMKALSQIKGIAAWRRRKYGRGLLEAIQRGAQRPLSWDARPPNNHSRTSSRPSHRPSARCQARFEALRAWRNAKAEAQGVEPDIVFTNHTLWAVAERNPKTQAELRDNLLAPWQIDQYGDDLLRVLRQAG